MLFSQNNCVHEGGGVRYKQLYMTWSPLEKTGAHASLSLSPLSLCAEETEFGQQTAGDNPRIS